MGRRLSGLEDDDRDGPVGLALVVLVVAVALDETGPVRGPLLVARLPRADAPALAALELDLRLRGRQQVVEPRRVFVGPALGGDDQEPVAVGQVDQWRDPR